MYISATFQCDLYRDLIIVFGFFSFVLSKERSEIE